MNELGNALMMHNARRRERRLHLVMATLGLVAGGGFLLIGFYRWTFALSNYGPAVVWRWSAAWLAVGLLFLVIGLVGAAWVFRWNWLTVTTFENGLQIQRRRNVTSVTWSEIQAILVSGVTYGVLGVIWGSRSSLRLDISGGRRMRFSDTLAGLAQLITTIKRHIYPRLLNEYSQHLRNGQPIPFGPLQVRPEGVAKGRQRLGWNEVASAELKDGKILLKPTQRRAPIRVRANAVPNAEICLQLIQHYAKQSNPQNVRPA
ncbi:MAG: hypothetical protein BMS9Abin28_2525 [Anaerolineae bacterium]|nr:MAG: hypothetical protein BMS9Abin28_2525 [Anaerolineae bacterium]